MDWMAEAACRGQDPDNFVPLNPMRSEALPRRLAEVCNRCSVAPQCLAYALKRPGLLGCWGGTTDRERRELRRRLAA